MEICGDRNGLNVRLALPRDASSDQYYGQFFARGDLRSDSCVTVDLFCSRYPLPHGLTGDGTDNEKD